MDNLTIALFAKKATNSEGRNYTRYFTTLTRKDGSTLTCRVSFKGGEKNAPAYEDCPMNVIINRTDANLAKKLYTNEETAEVYDVFTLWVNKWEQGAPYVDHSLDDII